MEPIVEPEPPKPSPILISEDITPTPEPPSEQPPSQDPSLPFTPDSDSDENPKAFPYPVTYKVEDIDNSLTTYKLKMLRQKPLDSILKKAPAYEKKRLTFDTEKNVVESFRKGERVTW